MPLAPTYTGRLADGEMPVDLLRVRPFLTAEWRHLAMLNYRVAPALLAPYVPAGTELDAFDGAAYMSLVAFMFSNTRVLGVGIPGHRTFEEVNLRFYVRRRTPAGERRRGVVFVKEVVPRRAIALVARATYNEPYVTLPMRHQIVTSADGGVRAEYGWRTAREWHVLTAEATGPAAPIDAGSAEEFITEHYWGYTAQRGGGTVEYRVTHPRWNVWRAAARLTGPRLDILYGPALGDLLASEPDSALLADGSAVSIEMPNRLADAPSPSVFE